MGKDSVEKKKCLQTLQQLREDLESRDSKCCCPNCSNKAINYSHVLQKALILLPLTRNKHLYMFHYHSLPEKNGISVGYLLKGYKKAFAFKGFCHDHDNNVFAPIEPNDYSVDWTSEDALYRTAYRTLCRELYVNGLAIDMNTSLHQCLDGSKYMLYLQQFLTNLRTSRSTLFHYKKVFEDGIQNKDYSKYKFYSFKLPFKFELCVASPIAGTDKRGVNFNMDFQELNIVNVFPYGDSTIVILGYSPEHDNLWLNSLVELFAMANASDYIIDKAHYYNTIFVDILFRAEFHCMSPKLYDSLDKDQLSCFLELWNKLRNDSSFDIASRNRLFCNTFKTLLT